uniref:UBX domain-containing protein n=1 Tax=Strongyloides venezuelensis TaxID=75913 RepID=A0A0K0F2P2_STRVS
MRNKTWTVDKLLTNKESNQQSSLCLGDKNTVYGSKFIETSTKEMNKEKEEQLTTYESISCIEKFDTQSRNHEDVSISRLSIKISCKIDDNNDLYRIKTSRPMNVYLTDSIKQNFNKLGEESKILTRKSNPLHIFSSQLRGVVDFKKSVELFRIVEIPTSVHNRKIPRW